MKRRLIETLKIIWGFMYVLGAFIGSIILTPMILIYIVFKQLKKIMGG